MAHSRDFSSNNSNINTRKRQLAIFVALSLAGIGNAIAAGEQTITVSANAANGPQESAWGPAPTIAAKRSATGTKTDTALEKNPQSVSVVTSQEIELRQPQSVKEAFGYSAGVMVGNRGASNVIDALAIRGFSETNTNQYFNGLKLPADFYSEFSIDPYFLERAELLRGPTSVLYGRSNPGGIVSMISKRPTTETLREVQFQMGSNNLYATGFDFGGALDDNNEFSYRLTGKASSADAQQQMNKEKRYTIAPSFSWQPDEKTNFTFLSYFQNEPETGYYGWLPREGTVVPLIDANGNQHKLSTDFDDGDGKNKISRKQQMVGYSFDHEFNDTWTVRQNLRYAKVQTDYRSLYGYGVIPGTTTLQRSTAVSDEDLSSFAVDTQAQAKFATGAVDHTLLLGVDFQRMHNDINAGFGYLAGSSLDLLNPQYSEDAMVTTYPNSVVDKQQQTGLYAQDQMEWDRWVLTLGGRYDYAMTSVYNRNAAAGTDPLDKRNDQAFTWRGGINYVFDNGIAPYASYSESFIPTSGKSFTQQAFEPSRAKQYEAGVKFVPKDRPIIVTAAVYELTKTKNLTADLVNPGYSIMGGEIRSRGIELEAKAAVNANINVLASYSFTDAKYTKDSELQGQRPVQVPRNMASLWADYTFHETALSGLTIGSGIRYVGNTVGQYSTGTDINKNFSVASYSVVDAAVKYDLGRFGLPGSSVGVNINNLFDREYVASCYRDYACYWGADRQIIGTATFRF
ncbi:ferrichrome porin FhuA [Erwinia sp. S38]|uniref:ferrichrome porin FhuA n=1 Tax=Erwinia sp. S38 TaxID=2769338 RepID=UPI00190A013E|nr:ferrichrome porin FhuA [Erwinia sp. S38]MBK0001217.1 ferrichrome porin FhuA [Erwinia sp. S38]